MRLATRTVATRTVVAMVVSALLLASVPGLAQPQPPITAKPPLTIGGGLVSRELVLIAGGVAGVFGGMWVFEAGLRLLNRPPTTILAAMRETGARPAGATLTAWAMVCTLGGVFLGLEAGKAVGEWLFPPPPPASAYTNQRL